jgi:hypothetical protein
MKGPNAFLAAIALAAVHLAAAGSRGPSSGGSPPAGDSAAGRQWTSGTAFTMPAGRWEIGLFQALRYAWSGSVELSTHPLAFFLIPNLSVKWSHGSRNGFQIATRHSLTYPTPLLRAVSRKGIGGLISPEFTIPQMVSIFNEVIVSRPLGRSFLATADAGVCFAIKSGWLDERTTIDLPIVFPRLNVYYAGYGFHGGTDLRVDAFRRWRIQAGAEAFYYPSADERFAFEQKGLLLWNKSVTFQLCAGYRLSYGEYPFGTQWHLLAPVFDLAWGWGGK